MGKIRVKDLASKMGMANQDLLFKLRSIGVRVEGENSPIDSDVIQAILQGKRLPQPREVILRDDSAEEGAPPVVRRPPLRQPPPSSLRPTRRSMVQRVSSRIRSLDRPARPGETPAPAAPQAPPKAPPAAAKPTPQAPPPKAPEPPPAEAPAAPAATVAKTAKPAAQAPAAGRRERPPTPAVPPRSNRYEAPPEPAAKSEATAQAPAADKPTKMPLRPARQVRRARLIEGPPKNYKSPRPSSRPGPRRPMVPSEPVRKMEPVSERGKRRAKKRAEGGGGDGATLQFREDRPQGPVTLTEGMTVRDFADKLGVKAKDLMKALFSRGIMATINHVLDPQVALDLAEEMGVEALEVSFEEEVQLQHELESSDGDEAEKADRAPVVTVMGHVDHGKTSLLDAIRSTKVAEGEAGGITQHIGAYHVDVGDRKIVFLDTPGHEAFTLMRARGARVTDIVILVVAADDGVMPQTLEAIDHAQAAKVPLVVAINKIDKANANLDRVKKDLADKGLMVEDWGGDTVAVPISALKGEGIDELLEMVLLTTELLELKAAPSLPGQGAVLEARKEIGRGIVATVLVQDGTVQVGDTFVAGATWGRVRSMIDDDGKRIEEAPPATPVEVTGFNDVPGAGDTFQVVEDEAKARSIAEFRQREDRQRELAAPPGRLSLEQLFQQIDEGERKELPVIVKADVHGSVEVVRDTLQKLSTEKVEVKVIHTAVGAITTNDVILASASNAIIVGFNVRPERNAQSLADKEQVDLRLHTVIYELADELKKAMTGLLEPEFKEVIKGTAEVRETFKVPKIGVVAGCHVTEGVIPRGASARVLRDNVVVYEGKLASLRRFKDDAAEVRQGFDCGIGLDHFQDVKPGDLIEAYVREEVAAAL